MGIVESIFNYIYVKILLIGQYTLQVSSNSITNIDFTKPGTGSRTRWGLTSLIFGPIMNYLAARGLTPFWVIVVIIAGGSLIISIYISIRFKKNPFITLFELLISPPILIGLIISIAFCLWSQHSLNTTGKP